MRPTQPMRVSSGFRGIAIIGRLDHADQAIAGQRIMNHRQIARLENVERQVGTRKHQSARQRKYRKLARQVLDGAIVFRFMRPMKREATTVAGGQAA